MARPQVQNPNDMPEAEIYQPSELTPKISQSAPSHLQLMYLPAQACPEKRNTTAVRALLRQMAKAEAERWYYAWPVKNKDGSVEIIKGPSIGMAMAILRELGNNTSGGTLIGENQTHMLIRGYIVDIEKGTTFSREFKQRKNQNISKKMDGGRAEDLVFQIGQSKAIRNAVIGLYRDWADELVSLAESGVLKKIEGNPEGARKYLGETYHRFKIPINRVEAKVGIAFKRWDPRTMAFLYSEVQQLIDDFVDAETLYPPDEEDDAPPPKQVAPAKQQDPKPAATAPKEEPKAEAPAAEPEPEPEPEQQAEEPEPQGDAGDEDEFAGLSFDQ